MKQLYLRKYLYFYDSILLPSNPFWLKPTVNEARVKFICSVLVLHLFHVPMSLKPAHPEWALGKAAGHVQLMCQAYWDHHKRQFRVASQWTTWHLPMAMTAAHACCWICREKREPGQTFIIPYAISIQALRGNTFSPFSKILHSYYWKVSDEYITCWINIFLNE